MADLTLDDILATSEAEATEVGSLIALTTGLKTQLDQALVGEPISPAGKAKMDKIFASLQAQKDAVTAAILANTPSTAAPTPDIEPAAGALGQTGSASAGLAPSADGTPAAGAPAQTVG